ncbi:AAA family ATPase [Chloroflexota bacterium]
MIPVKLTLHNFMCYRDNVPPLNFDGIHLACLSGDNGNGKSALIDAITWALWGKARASSDDDLIHTLQTEMEIEFIFKVGEQLYRIIRKRSRPRKRGSPGQPVLEFQIHADNGFMPITGNSITQTQQKIIDTLHMDYDTFVNSAYLRQGHADEFTRQAPAKRKEVLGNILGLARYDELEEQAKGLAKQQETDKSQLEITIRDIGDELARQPAYEAELEQAQNQLTLIETTAGEKEAGLHELRQKKESLENKKAQLNELEIRIRNSTNDLQRWDEQVKQHQSRLKDYEEVINRRSSIEEGYGQFTRARQDNEELEQKFRQSVNLERQRAKLDARIKEAGHSLNTEHAVVQREITNLEVKAQKLPELKNQLAQVQSQIHRLAESETALRQKEQVNQELQAQVNHLESEKASLEREISGLSDKISLISSQTEASCPLCETELSKEGLELIAAKYATEKQSKSDLLKSKQAEQSQKQNNLSSLQNEKSQIEAGLNQERAKTQSQAGILLKEIAETEEANKQIAGLRETLEGIELRLSKRDFAGTEQEALGTIETELAILGYDSEKHEQTRQQLRQIESYDQENRKLEEAVRLINQEKEAVSRAEEATQGLRHSLTLDNQKKESLTTELTQLPQLLNELAQAEAEHRNITIQRSQAQETVGSVKAKIQRCAELETRKKDKDDQLFKVSKDENIFRELAKAFGKTGIQALLIEMVLPEIESEANRLLGRMTDNRMHVKFETQRETKKGSVIETLDINIADELGTRNYEMFSGGEAFRINFAIRIALSKLLARRAGARLPTLIIDEGFGTQDNTGIEKLKEAINSIQSDFEKILVITHMDEMKDAFPVRIDVTKTAEGSTISIN